MGVRITTVLGVSGAVYRRGKVTEGGRWEGGKRMKERNRKVEERGRREAGRGDYSITMLRMQLLISEISRSLRGVREARPILEGIEGSSYNML
ncbi:MAG: hypothetical protein QXP38_08670 [Nitrososphaerota archaeon]